MGIKWPVLQSALEYVPNLELPLPAAVRGLLLGMTLGLMVGAGITGVLLAINLAGNCWSQRRRTGAARRPKPLVVRFVVPPDDWSPDLDQFTEAELVKLHRLRQTYRARRPLDSPSRSKRPTP